MKDALAVALVHFVWQGAALAVIGFMLMRLAKVPSIRYVIGVATMMAMLAAPVLTFLAARPSDPLVAAAASSHLAGEPAGVTRVGDDVIERKSAPGDSMRGVFLPSTWIVSLWALGVGVLSLRFAGGLAMARRVATRAAVPVCDDLQRLAARLASRLKVRGMVRICESASVAVPVMVGWLRPVVVLPPAALATLPLSQLEALLAHEFAHIRRHDYLVNLLQTAVETVCFYHPAVWWISNQVRLAREQCCDDVAVSVCDRLTYVTALSTLASLSTPRLALAATGGSLRDRVRRLVDPPTHSASAKGGWMAMLPILLVVSLVAPHAWGLESPEQISTSTPVVVAQVKPAVPVVTQVRPSVRVMPPVIKVKPVVVEMKPLTLKVPPASVRVERALRVELDQVPAEERAAAAERIKVEQAIVEKELQLARRRDMVEAQAEMATLESRLRQEAVALQRQEELFERGLVTRRALAEAEERLAAAKQRLDTARALSEAKLLLAARAAMQRKVVTEAERLTVESQLRRDAVALERQQELAARGLVTERALEEAQARVAETRQRVESADRQRAISDEVAELERRLAEVRASPSRPTTGSPLDPDAPVQTQDRLTIIVAGEPDLPTSFTVRADGSIRFPFLGVIRVQGSTARQVQSVVQKLIVDRGLADNPTVSVSVERTLRRVR